jgi:alkylation response protein AidB-like acyl-CoA dehydrogenase
VVQGRLADAALARDGLGLVAWECASSPEDGLPREALAWAGRACCEVTRQALQVHGGIGFALESGVHRPYRRAKAAQAWVDGVLVATA